MESQPKILIIGGVAAGPKVAARARRLMPEAEITVIEQGEMISYGNCGLPLFMEGLLSDIRPLTSTAAGVPRDTRYFADEKKVKFLTQTRALQIQRQDKIVTLLDIPAGREYKLPYDQLVLATGSKAVIPKLSGTDLTGVTPLHHPAHARLIKDAVKGGAKKIVIIGAGLVGLETAAALTGKDREIVLLERENQLLPGVLDREIAELLHVEMVESGVEVHLGENLESIEGNEFGQVQRVITTVGTIEAELVILACGVRPDVQLARDCGLRIGPTGAIQVDGQMLTSDPHIYAAGDCVENKHLVSGEPVYVPMASTANKQGRVIGSNLAGMQDNFPGILGTMAMQVFEYNVGKTGLTEKQARAGGLKVTCIITSGHDTAHYHPMHGAGVIKIIADSKSGKIIGAQAAGNGELIKRIDVLATAMQFGATVEQIQNLDLGYAPPFSTPMDLLIHAANTWQNVNSGLVQGISPQELRQITGGDDQFVILDVRTSGETQRNPFPDRRVLEIPLMELRARIDELPAEKKIITLCQLGVRAYEAARILQGEKFNDVVFVEGGMFAIPVEN